MRHIDHLPHIQYIVAHQSTITYRKRKCQLNRNQQANLIKVKYKAKVLIPSWIFLRNTAQQVKFSIKDFSSKCDQIRRKRVIWSHLLKKFLMGNFIFLCIER